MLLAPLDEEQAAGRELVAAAVDVGLASAREHEKPLIRAAMAIVGPTLGVAGREHHLCGLRRAVSAHDAKPLAEAQRLFLHRILMKKKTADRPMGDPPPFMSTLLG